MRAFFHLKLERAKLKATTHDLILTKNNNLSRVEHFNASDIKLCHF